MWQCMTEIEHVRVLVNSPAFLMPVWPDLESGLLTNESQLVRQLRPVLIRADRFCCMLQDIYWYIKSHHSDQLDC